METLETQQVVMLTVIQQHTPLGHVFVSHSFMVLVGVRKCSRSPLPLSIN